MKRKTQVSNTSRTNDGLDDENDSNNKDSHGDELCRVVQVPVEPITRLESRPKSCP